MVTAQDRLSEHLTRINELQARVRDEDTLANKISVVRLVTFLAGAVAVAGAFKGVGANAILASIACVLAFLFAVIWHARVLARKNSLLARKQARERHVARITLDFAQLSYDGAALIPKSHDYAWDIDLVGPGSLFQRIDTTHTVEGARSLAHSLSTYQTPERIRARQGAVEELSAMMSFREELETRATERKDKPEKLDHAPFANLLTQPRLFEGKPALVVLTYALPGLTLSGFLLSSLEVISSSVPWGLALVQAALLWSLREPVHRTLNVVTARLGFAEAYEGMLRLLEQTDFQSPHLKALKQGLLIEGRVPSAQMARLRRYEGLAQLRTQGPVYIFVNILTCWDLHCVLRIEAWLDAVGPGTERWFAAIGELEMLCSLASLHHGDPTTTMPALDDDLDGALVCEGLAHPLLKAKDRVANDIALEGTRSARIVTGSNMAGKSTLLRAVGLNVALALAGGPVCARHMRLAVVRLRASMRVEDSLQRGASYFHAELEKLKSIIRDAEQTPHVLFLLDELLRGTNARARSQGARSIVEHLLARGALGLVATHDVALSDLEEKYPGRVRNCHFTDVFVDGEMRFDYVLRAGPVRTSNALRLLKLAGIEVPEDDRVQ